MKNAREARQTNVSVKMKNAREGREARAEIIVFFLNMQISDVLVVVAFVIAQARNCLFSERSKYLKTVFVRQVHDRNLRYSTICFLLIDPFSFFSRLQRIKFKRAS